MKKIFALAVFTLLFNSILFAQTLQLVMSPKPSPYFSDWQNKTETALLIVNNPSKEAISCKIKTQLFNSKEEMVGETDFSKMPVLTLEPGISQFNAEDIYPVDAIKLYGNSLTSMLKTGKIPEDNYRLCTDLVDPLRGTPLTPLSPQCKSFSIVDYQAPVLLSPREDQIIPESEIRSVMFRWTPVTPSANQLVIYRLQIWEVLEGQTKADACRNNMPVYEKDLRSVLQTGWPIDFALAEGTDNYVWSITPLDDEDRKIVSEGYGMAEPFGFRIKGHIGMDDACKDFTVEFMDLKKIYTGDSGGVEPIMTNSYRGTAPRFKARTFRLEIKNAKFIGVEGNLEKGWERTPSKFPPGSSEIKWTNNSGDLPPGKIMLGTIIFLKTAPEPVSLFYEWLNIDGKVICKDSAIRYDTNNDGTTQSLKLVSPKNGERINIDNPEFRWLNFKVTNDREKYRLRIVEIRGDESPEDAFQIVDSFFDIWTELSADGGEIIYKYPESAPKFEAGKKYAWAIQSEKKKDYDWDEAVGDLRSSISIFDRWGLKIFAFRWKTDYRVERSDILDYLKTQELYMRQGEYRFDYSTNPFGDVRIPLAKPIPDKGINKAGMMFAVDCSDETCKTEGEACYGNPGGNKNCLITPVIENGFITQTILSFRGDNSYQNDNGGDMTFSVKLSQPAPNQLRLSDLSNFTLTNLTQKPVDVNVSCSLAAGEPKPILIIIIVLKRITLPPGTTTFTWDDVKTGTIKYSSDEWRQAFEQTGNAPTGDYSLCVSALDPMGKEIGKDCFDQIIKNDVSNAGTIQSLTLISPSEDQPPTSVRPTFEWKKANPQDGESFSIVVREIPEVGEPENGVMVLERSNIRETTLPYPKNTPSLDPAKSYGWHVSWFKNGKLVGSTLFTRFKFSKESDSPQKKVKLESPIGSLGGNDGIKDGIAFRWTAGDPKGPFSIKIVEIKGDQSPDAALQNNPTHFEQNKIEGTTFKYPESAPKFEKGKKYAWRVEAPENGPGVGGNSGKALSSGDTGSFTLAACGTILFTPVLLCAGNNMYTFSLACQNAADPGTDPNCSVVLTAISLLASSIPVTVTSSLPLTIQPGQTSTITGQLGPILNSTIQMFSVLFTSPNGSGGYAPAFTLPLPPSSPGAITGLSNICQGQTGIVYSVASVTDAASYNWSVPAGSSITSGQGTNSITLTAGTVSGTVCVSAVNACATSLPNCKPITVNLLPAQPGTITGSATPCVGSSQNYSVPNVNGVTYTWNFPPGWTPAGGTTHSVTKTTGTGAGTITVTPSNACGTGPTQTLAVTPASIIAPTAPTAGTGSGIQFTQFTATWTPVAGATSYHLDVSTNPAFANFVPGYGNLTVGSVTTYNVTGLSCGTPYFYRVRATSGCGITSSNSNFRRVNTLASPAPTANPGSGIQSTQFTANWTAVAGASYILNVSTISTFGTMIYGYYNLSVGTATSYIVTGLSCNTKYYYRIQSVGACGGPSASSNAIIVTTSVATPQTPVALAATGLQGTQFTANWTAVAGADSYILEVAPKYTFSNYEDPMINTPGYGGQYYLGMYQTIPVGAATSYTVTGLSWHSNNYYRVRAVSCSQTSSNSNIMTVVIPFPEVHGSWIRENPGTYSFTIGVLGSTADITGVVGQSIPVTMEIWGAGGGGGSGSNGFALGRDGGGGGGGGGYSKKIVTIWIPPQSGGSYTYSYYVKIGAGGNGGSAGGAGNNGIKGGDSEARQISAAYPIELKATGGLGGTSGSKNFPARRSGGAGGIGSINNLPGQAGVNGAIGFGFSGGAGGAGGTGGGLGNINAGGNGGKGGNQMTSGTAGGNGRVVITW